MTSKRFVGVAILIGGWGLAGANARAELPPGSYDKLRMDAHEAIIVKVDSVTAKELKSGWIDVVLTARVVSVERSKSHLETGGKVTIRYETRDPAKVKVPGPRPTPVLKKGETYPAFLNANVGAGTFEPAAFGESFRMTPEG